MRKTSVFARFFSWTLMLILIVTAIPFSGAMAEANYAYIIIPNATTNRVVNFRPLPGSSDYIDLLPEYWVVEVIGETTKNEALWYQVTADVANFTSSTKRTGYIKAEYVQLMTAEETAVYLANPGKTFNPSAPATDPDSAYGVITVNGVPLKASIGGESIDSLAQNTVVNVITVPAGNTESHWYYVEIGGKYGYVQAPYLKLLKTSELSSYTLPPAPAVTTPPSATDPIVEGAITGYVKLTKDLVNIRKTPGGTVLTPTNDKRLPKDLILSYIGLPASQGGYSWVYITYNSITGYVRSDCYTYCDDKGNPISVVPTPVPDTTPIPGTKYFTLQKGGVNVRKTPGGKATGLQLAKGTILQYSAIQKNTADGTLWFYAYVPQLGGYGYILSTMGYISDDKGKPTGETPAPGPGPDPTAGPTTAPILSGYVATSLSSVWVRNAPAANADTVGKVANKLTVLPLTGTPVNNPPYTWYPVQLSDGTRGYIRGDCVFQMEDWQYAYYLLHGVCPTPSPAPATPKPGNSSYVITTAGSLWVRETPSKKASTLTQIKSSDTVLKFTDRQQVSGVTWYKVSYNGETGWIHGGYARVMTNAEYEAYIGKLPTPTPKPTPTAMPDPSQFTDIALTTDVRVKLRKTGSMSGKELTLVENAGSELKYLGHYTVPTTDNPYYWFNVQYRGVSGWMRGDFVRVLTVEEKAMYELAGDPDAPREASYRTLSTGDTGEDVLRLNQALSEKGYLDAKDVSSDFLSATEKAVIAFQKASGLTVDGIAGEKTQHALYGTVPVGTYTEGSVESILYPVEMIDWYTGGIQTIWKVGVKAIVTDVYTGIAWRAQRIYGDAHADVEPATKDDTAAYCKIFKVSNPQEISDRETELQSWRRRPLWVTIGNRTFCASLYGVPHNFPGDMIPDNGFNGQVCIHFVNSKTHGTKVVDYDRPENGNFGHQSAIKYAYQHSISGQK